MNQVQLNDSIIQEIAERATVVLRSGGVILYPTDTLYGLGADALSDKAVEKIYSIKGREQGKPIHAIVADLEMAAQYGEVDDRVRMLAETFSKGKITFVVKKKANLNSGIMRNIDTFGFRIPDNEFCLELVREFDGPITATSANRSGEPTRYDVESILKQIGGAASEIDLAINGGTLPKVDPSTVIDLSQGSLRVVREGAVPSSAIFAAL